MPRRRRWVAKSADSWRVRTGGPIMVAVVTAAGAFAGFQVSEASSTPWMFMSVAAAGLLAFRGARAGADAWGGRQRSRADGANLGRNRQVLIERVHSSWITGVFEPALDIIGWIDLTWLPRPDVIARRGTGARHSPLHSGRLEEIPSADPLDTVFDRTGEALLVLGRPGSGKTILLLQLTHRLLERARDDAGQPIPAVFSLSTWSLRRPPLDEWLVRELADIYEIPRRLGRALVDDDQVLPVLDGLDLVDAEHREECVEAINFFRDEHGTLPMVVSCRTDEYCALSEQLRLRAAVEIQPLTHNEVSAILQQTSGLAARVRAALDNDPTLWNLLDSPVWLSVLCQAARADAAPATPGAGALPRRHDLLSTYVEEMLSRDEGRRYPYERTVQWLAWLAKSLNRHRQSEFSLDRLDLDWLSPTSKRIVIGGSALLAALVAGLFFGLLFGRVDEHGLTAGLVAGVVGGVIAGVFYVMGASSPDVRVASQLRWSWSAARIGLWSALLIALVAGVAAAILAARLGATSPVWDGVVFGLQCGLLVGLASGLSLRDTDSQTDQRGLVDSPYLPLVAALVAWGAVAGRWDLWFGLQAGLFAGLTTFLARALYPGRRRTEWLAATAEPPRPVRSTIAVAAVAALLYGLLAGLIFGQQGFSAGAKAMLYLGLSAGVTAGLFYALGQRSDTIRSAELMRWSWAAFRSGLRPVLAFAGIAGILAGLTMGAMAGSLGSGGIEVREGLRTGSAVALLVAVLGGLVNGLSTSQLSRPSITPNEGVRRSIRHGLFVGLVVGLGVALLIDSVSYGWVAGLVAFLFFGGLAAFQHILTRIMLAATGTTPWRLAHFLGYAADHSILRRLGGGYIFANQLLLEHFASPDLDPVPAAVAWEQ